MNGSTYPARDARPVRPGAEQPGALIEQLGAIFNYHKLLAQLKYPRRPALWQLARERCIPHARRSKA